MSQDSPKQSVDAHRANLRTARHEQALPPSALAGMRVLEVGHGIAAPFAAKLLADMGADVVKVEAPAAPDAMRAHGPFRDDRPDGRGGGLFQYLNANKRGVSLDVACARGRAMFDVLAAQADVFIVNGSVRSIEEKGLGFERLAKTAPQLVVTTITPFGFGSPLSGHAGEDITICALGGVTAMVGEPGRAPLTPPLSLSWYQAGLAAASAALLALFARDQSGSGQHVDISPLDVWATAHQGTVLADSINHGVVAQRAGRRRNDAYPYHLLEAQDGLMCLIARDGKQWKRFITEVVRERELLENPRYRDRRVMGRDYPHEVDAILRPWFAVRTRAEIFAACRASRVPFSPVRRIDEMAECEHLRARGFFVDLPQPDGIAPLRVPGAPYRFGRTPWKIRLPAPTPGQHNAEIFAGIGVDAPELAELRRTGVI